MVCDYQTALNEYTVNPIYHIKLVSYIPLIHHKKHWNIIIYISYYSSWLEISNVFHSYPRIILK